MAAMWLNLSGIKEKVFLLDALLSSPGLYGDKVNAVTDRFQDMVTLTSQSTVNYPHSG